jgi:hypothetical protein
MRQTASVALAFILGTAALLLGLNWMRAANEREPILRQDVVMIQAAAEQNDGPNPNVVPLYPGASEWRETSTVSTHPTMWKTIYATTDPHEKVTAYYRDHMPSLGWVMTRGGTYPSFVWKDKDGNTPWSLLLEVSVTPSYSGGTGVTLLIDYWPDANKIPVPNNREYDKVTTVLTKNENKQPVRTTTYLTSAKPDEILDYYEAVLRRWGWEKGYDNTGDFFSSYDGVKLTVEAHQSRGGFTQVELRFIEFGPVTLH